jgi:hypothetical protein
LGTRGGGGGGDATSGVAVGGSGREDARGAVLFPSAGRSEVLAAGQGMRGTEGVGMRDKCK